MGRDKIITVSRKGLKGEPGEKADVDETQSNKCRYLLSYGSFYGRYTLTVSKYSLKLQY